MLEIEKKLSIVFYSQIDKQMECMNQEIEQYLRFFVNHRQKDWLEWLAIAEFVVNNKRKSIKSNEVYRKDKESIGESWGSIKKSIERNKVISRQEKKKSYKVILSTKNLVFREQLTKKLTKRYVELYIIEKIVSANVIKLNLPESIRIHLVINVLELQKVDLVSFHFSSHFLFYLLSILN